LKQFQLLSSQAQESSKANKPTWDHWVQTTRYGKYGGGYDARATPATDAAVLSQHLAVRLTDLQLQRTHAGTM
jgi:hypothetical protein